MRMFVVVRADLSPAQQAVQGMHALADFAAARPATFDDWHEDSNTLVFLSLPDEEAVKDLFVEIGKRQDAIWATREPDIGHQLTAIAFLETAQSRPWTKKLRRALEV